MLFAIYKCAKVLHFGWMQQIAAREFGIQPQYLRLLCARIPRSSVSRLLKYAYVAYVACLWLLTNMIVSPEMGACLMDVLSSAAM